MNITANQLRRLAPASNVKVVASLVGPLNKWLPQYGIDTPTRLPHFFAQAAEETDHFKTLHEYATGKEYEGRHDLGNTHAGDGARYKGRGIFQLTGRANYHEYGQKLGLDLEGNPDLAADPDVCVRTACEYWKKKGLSALADRDDIDEITHRINGGHNGLAERKRLLGLAKTIFGKDDDTPAEKSEPVPQPKPRPSEAPEADEAADDTPAPRKKTGVTEGGSVVGAGTAIDTINQANDTLSTIKDTKENVQDLGFGDMLAALLSNPRFLVSAIFLVAIVGGVIYWQWAKHRRAA